MSGKYTLVPSMKCLVTEHQTMIHEYTVPYSKFSKFSLAQRDDGEGAVIKFPEEQVFEIPRNWIIV